MSEDSKIDQMVGEFKELSDLQAYCDAQYKTIIDLNKQINKLKDEKSHVEKLLPVASPGASGIIQFPTYSISDEEEICLTQLKILNDISKRGQLTLEETKKCEIYTKILVSLRNNVKDIEIPGAQVPTEDLIKQLKADGQ